MFHKEHSIQGRKKAIDVPLRKSDRRKVLDRAKIYFGSLGDGNSADESSSSRATLDSILEATFLQGNLAARSLPMVGGKAWNMTLYLKTPSSPRGEPNGPTEENENNTDTWPYTTSSQFVWMALEEKNRVVQETPTVALWAVLSSALPQLIESYAVWVPSPVSKFVCRGADLMKAGMRSLPQGKEMVPVVAQGNPQPFAVGQVKNPNEAIGVGTNGVGVQIWNAYGDDIWRSSMTKEQCLGSKCINQVGGAPFDNGHYGNVGFIQGKMVLPITDSYHETDEEASGDEEFPNEERSGSEEAKDEHDTKPSILKPQAATVDDDPPAAPKIQDEQNEPEEEPTTPDEVLHRAVLRGLLHLSKKDLPMPVGTFYAKYVSKGATTIDLKATTYKKFGQYLKVQMERGLLQAGRDKNNPRNTDPMATLTGYHKNHEDFRGIPKPLPESNIDGSSQMSKLVMVMLYVIPKDWIDLMRLDDDDVKAINATSEERRGTGLLTASEARKILEDYIVREALITPSRPDQAALDGPLTRILYKKENITPERLLRKDLVKQFMAKLLPAYALVEMPGSKITKLAKGTPPTIEIEVSMRQSKKFITRVRGLEDYGIDATYFAKDVSKRLACSSTVETSASSGRPALRKNHVEIVLQGCLVDEIEALLVDESLSSHGGVKGSTYSVPKQVLAINLRKGVPGRKKGGSKK